MLLLLPQRYVFSSKSQPLHAIYLELQVVVATTKVRIFKQITTMAMTLYLSPLLLLLPQRYVFSSKSQRVVATLDCFLSCCCYHKGTYFQANHNAMIEFLCYDAVVVATTKVRIFKQITTNSFRDRFFRSCCCYHKGTYFQANHNTFSRNTITKNVVVATTKVRIFKQITTGNLALYEADRLLLLPQRYVFSSKSQLLTNGLDVLAVVVATTKVRIFKQITTIRFVQ